LRSFINSVWRAKRPKKQFRQAGMLPPLEEIDLSVRNRSKQPVAARIGHRVDPVSCCR